MNARKYARGTRRPGGRSTRGGRISGGKAAKSGSGCVLLLLALAALPAIVAAVTR